MFFFQLPRSYIRKTRPFGWVNLQRKSKGLSLFPLSFHFDLFLKNSVIQHWCLQRNPTRSPRKGCIVEMIFIHPQVFCWGIKFQRGVINPDTPWKINGWNLQITHLERTMIWTKKPPWWNVPAVNLQGCKIHILSGWWRFQTFFWANYSDLSRGHLTWWFSMGIPHKSP